MKTIPFIKMVAAGNDFVLIESVPPKINLPALARKMCSRTEGIGADGLMILEKSRQADYKMRIINADGSEAEMCGNGARCLAVYIQRSKSVRKNLFSLETLAGEVLAQAKGDIARVRLSDPVDYRPDMPLALNGRKIRVHYIDTGVPHTIIFVDRLKDINVSTIGRLVRNHSAFAPRGTNVDFVEQIKENFVEVRTYERGVESETRACGTGSVASAIVAYRKARPAVKTQQQVTVKVLTKSSEVLDVTFDIHNGRVSNVWLKGRARFIAKGDYYV